jgi:SAM-dependent methyltransferase
MKDADTAAEKWNTAHRVPNYRRRFLNSLPWAQSYLHKLYLGGRPPFALLADRLARKPVANALELAGGRGDFAIALLRAGLAQQVLLLDVSHSAVEIAAAKAVAADLPGLTAGVADVNALQLDRKYDLVAFSQSLHHIEALEHVLDQVHQSLTPGGVFFVSDYIGPTRMQWSDAELTIMNDLLSLVPKTLRGMLAPDGSDTGHTKDRIKRIPLDVFARVDPSEAVRSGEIDQLIRQTFPLVEFFPLGGGVSYELFRMIAHNFDTEDETVRGLLRTVLYFEHELIKVGALQPSFGLYFCQG